MTICCLLGRFLLKGKFLKQFLQPDTPARGRCKVQVRMSEGEGDDASATNGVAGCSRSRDIAPSQPDNTDLAEGPKLNKSPKTTLSKRTMKRALRRQRQEEIRETKRRKKEEVAKQKEKEKEDEGNKEPVLSDENLNETTYYEENGLRKVYPYPFTFTTYAKGRWIGQTLLNIFVNEFRADTPENYQRAILNGKVTVNGSKVSLDYKLKDNDFLANSVHRHEIPVLAAPIKIIENTDDVLVVNKPCSIPVHPCGRYRHNSLTYILAKQYGHRNLRSIHRLDRLTSGLLIFGKTEKRTRELMEHVKNRDVDKEYLCRVVGEFPNETIECEEPIDILSPQLGLFKTSDDGKDACTVFQRVSYNGRTSVVKCKPYTGRTHQIRVHLQFLGYPIVNDPLYNSDVWGPTKGKDGYYGKSEEQLIKDLIAYHERIKVEMEVTAIRKSDATPSCSSVCGDIQDNQEKSDVAKDTKDSSNGVEQRTETSDESSNKNVKSSDAKVEDGDSKSSGSINASGLHEGQGKTVENKGETPTKINSEKGSEVSEKDCEAKEEGDTSNKILQGLEVSSGVADKDKSSDSSDKDLNKDESENVSKPSDTSVQTQPGVEGMPMMPDPIAMMRMQFDMLISASFTGDNQTGPPITSVVGQPEDGSDNKEGSPCDIIPSYEKSRHFIDPECAECKIQYRDPKPQELVMYLHAYRYKGPDWEYSTDVPEWAMADWQEPEA